jgi:hypothetical protein
VDIATNGVTTELIKDGQVTAAKLAAMGASNGQVLKYTNGTWAAGADSDTRDGGILTVTGSSGITGTVQGTNLALALPTTSVENRFLKWNNNTWTASDFSLRVSRWELADVNVPIGKSVCFTAPGATTSMVCASGFQSVYLHPTTDLICILNMRNTVVESTGFVVRCLEF